MEKKSYIIKRSPEEIDQARKGIYSNNSKKSRLSTTGSKGVDLVIEGIRNLGKCLTCPVCQSLLEQPIFNECMHAICLECYKGILASEKKKCPTCRNDLVSKFSTNEQCEQIVHLFRQLHSHRNGNNELNLSQVGTFSQLAKDLQSTPEEIDVKPSNSEVTTSIDLLTPQVSDLKKPLVKEQISSETTTTDQASRIKKHPIHELRENSSNDSKADDDDTLRSAERGTAPMSNETPLTEASNHKAGFSAGDEATPLKATTHAMTPPTVRLSNDVYHSPVLSAVTPSPSGNAVRQTPSTVKLEAIGMRNQENEDMSSKSTGDDDSSRQQSPPPVVSKKDPYRVGAVVTVSRRMGPGMNKPGGVAKITKRNPDGTFNVYYTVEGNREKNVMKQFISPGLDVNADSLFGKPNMNDNSDSELKTHRDELIKKEELEQRTKSGTDGNDIKQKSTKRSRTVGSTQTAISSSSNTINALDKGTRRQLNFSTPIKDDKLVGVVFTGVLSEKEREKLTEQVEKLGGTVLDPTKDGSDWQNVTHVVTSILPNEQLRIASVRSMKYLSGIALGRWIVDVRWVEESAHARSWQDEANFKVGTDTMTRNQNLPLHGPKRARIALESEDIKDNALFSGCVFAFVGKYDKNNLDPIFLTKALGGEVLSEVTIPLNKLDMDELVPVPVKTKSNKKKKIKSPDIYFVYPEQQFDKSDRQFIKDLNSASKKSVTWVHLQWFVNCVSAFELLDSSPYQIIDKLLE